MSLLDLITGGKSSDASKAMDEAIQALQAVGVPDAASLTLPELEKYVQAGVLTPQQVQAFPVAQNALNETSSANSGLDTELGAIGDLQDIINHGGNDATEKANVQSVLNKLGVTEKGANLAAVDQAAQRGTSSSGLTLAAMLANNSDAATAANTEGLDAASTASERNLGAITSKGNLGSAVQGQEYEADLNKANAANTIAQFNSGQQENVAQVNAAAANEAAKENLATKQAVSNANVIGKQTQQESGVQAQQQAFDDALRKATAVSGAYTNKAGNDTTQGQQQAGVIGGLISAGGQAAAAAGKPSPTGVPVTAAHGGEICMTDGGPVPGEPRVPGVDTEANDTVPARLSPHEVVIPASVAETRDPQAIMKFIRSLPQPERPSVHPKAVLDVLKAMDLHHKGQ